MITTEYKDGSAGIGLRGELAAEAALRDGARSRRGVSGLVDGVSCAFQTLAAGFFSLEIHCPEFDSAIHVFQHSGKRGHIPAAVNKFVEELWGEVDLARRERLDFKKSTPEASALPRRRVRI